MTLTLTDPSVPTGELAPANVPAAKPSRSQNVQPVLEKLFELYPHLFGANFMPLKLGIFQELLAAHPEIFERDTLKAALGLHTRSGRYLHSVAAGNPRYDLQGAVVEPVSPEHIYLAMLELFRRRQGRTQEDLRPRFRLQLMAAFEASGLTRQDYLTRVQSNAAGANVLLEEAFAERDVKLAKQEALQRAFESSGKTLAEFAEMYGLDPRDVGQAVERKP
ncbi:MAG: ProQ/FINO family protein [Rhodoferax sp.]|uniref:ProQ/FINO family protein n=1 Tax=Rhodoferax sp. TaxID=50421 RepID=UPI00301AD73A